MNIKRNQHCLNSGDCRFLVSIKERKPVRIQEIKNLARIYGEINTGEILMIMARFLVSMTEKVSTRKNLPKKRHGIVLNSIFISH